ncbi:hypothetical protein QEZ52_08450 [Aliisedimentitalea scapharcae]|uniref:Uncharacterized protein n=1 Tax=Aliisedimentitalea scapharcae TaxID=1524259 RepID=A0ABZ2XWT5_9RHOB
MFEIFVLAIFSLVVVLYAQARAAAREIRRNRKLTGASVIK